MVSVHIGSDLTWMYKKETLLLLTLSMGVA